jgi:hypothetical protein
LPAGVVALIGVTYVLRLGLSLDRIAAHPGCSLAEARPLSVAGRLLSCLGGLCSGVSRLFRRQQHQGGHLPDAPLAPFELREFRQVPLEPAVPLPGSLAPESRLPPSPRSNFLRTFRPTLDELKALHWNQQQARTRARIARLHSASPPAKAKKASHPRSPPLAHQSSCATGQPSRPAPRSHSLHKQEPLGGGFDLEPLMPRRGKAMFYGVRVGR